MICQFHHQVTLQPRIRVSSPSTLSIMTRGEEMQSWDPVSDLLRPRISYILSHYQAAPAPGRDPSKSHNIALTRGASVQTPDSDISSPWTEYQYPGSSWADAISPVPAKYSCIPDHVCEWLTDEAPPPRHWLGAASGQILQIFPAWARLWARTRRAGLCLAAWSAGPGTGDLPRSLESGSLYTVHWRTVHCTSHSCTVHRVTPYLHLQFIKSNCREDFYSHSTYCQLRLMEKYFPP